MAYTVLARRYRSTTFDEVVGQSHIAQTVKRAITSGRIAHAYLFCGTRGTGKTSMARILAKALNCQSSDNPTPEPCNKCISCLGITRGDDMDYVEIDAASNTGVDAVRDVIINNAAYRPARCRFKIFLIDEVHMLSKSAFNALLKTLEEPPEHVKFILATTEPEKLPNTILSRCQRYDFRNIASREVAGHLGNVCKQEGIDADEDALLMVARAGGGSMRDSLSLLDRLLSVGETRLTVAAIEQLLGLPRGEALAAIVSAMGAADPGATLRAADEILASGMSPDSLIQGLVDHLHNLLLLRVCGDKTELVEAPGIPPELLREQARRMDTIILTQDIAVLEELRRQLRTGAGGRALMDATLVRLALAEQFRSISELMGEVSDVAAQGGGDAQKKKPELTTLGSPHAAPAAEAHPAGAFTRTVEQLRTPPAPAAAVPPATPAPTPAAAPAPAPAPAPVAFVPAPVEEEDDDLPRPGKVWDNSGPSLSELLARKEGKAPPVAPAPSPGAAASNVEAVNEADLPVVWRNVIEGFRNSVPALLGTLDETRLGSVDSGTATIYFAPSRQFFASNLERDANKREKVVAALTEALGKPVGLKIVVEKAPQAPPPVAPAPTAPRVARPSRAEIEAMARETASAGPNATIAQANAVAASGNAIRITDELVAQLKQDDLIRAITETLGAQIVKVVEE